MSQGRHGSAGPYSHFAAGAGEKTAWPNFTPA
jgi:hypothetical protein